MQRDVLLAAVIGAHGLKGEVKVKTFTAAPASLNAYGPLHSKDGRSFTIVMLRAVSDSEAVVAFKEVVDRNASEALKGTELFVPRAKLPETDDDEFYYTDLIGLEAFDVEGRRVGKVLSIQNFGASDVLVLEGDNGGEILIAFTKANVPVVDVKNGRLTVAVPDEVESDEPRAPDSE